MQKTNVGIGVLFEVSWEVCNKVGEYIPSFLRKQRNSIKFRRQACITWVGYMDRREWFSLFHRTQDFVEECRVKGEASVRNFHQDRPMEHPGSPMVVLVGYKGMFEELNRIYGDMWNVYGVDSLHAYGDYDESCAFAVASAIVADALVSHLKVKSSGVVAHFDEWTLVWVSCILNT